MLDERAHAIALAQVIEGSISDGGDGLSLGLTDSALAAKALRLFASLPGGAEPRMPGAAPAEIQEAVSRRPAPSIPRAATARPEHA